MANPAFCQAVNTIASNLFPQGFDTSPNAPNNLTDLVYHVARTGRMVVSDHGGDSHEFDTRETYQAFRAWHDWCHIHGKHPFTLKGECAAVRLQVAMLTALYGRASVLEWLPILHQQIIRDNFGETAICPPSLPL